MINLKCYNDRLCNDPLEVKDNQLLCKFEASSGRPHNEDKNIFIKNVGDNTAYNVSAVISDNLGGKLTTFVNPTFIKPGEVAMLNLRLELEKNKIETNNTVNIQVSYDYLP